MKEDLAGLTNAFRLPRRLSEASAGAAGDVGLTPGSGRPPGGGNGDLLQYSC